MGPKYKDWGIIEAWDFTPVLIHSVLVTYVNKVLYSKCMGTCLYCDEQLSRRVAQYCSNKCQNDYQYEQYIILWKQGEVDGGRGVLAKNISGHVQRYLISNYGEQCTLCGWHEKHPITGKVPLEIDHVDGDSDNNREDNLRLICPNCHSLTPNFRNLNKGKGRDWRRAKYIRHTTQT